MLRNVCFALGMSIVSLSALADRQPGERLPDSGVRVAAPLTIIICKAKAEDTGASFIEHSHIRTSDEGAIKKAKSDAKKKALQLCKRYSDDCTASCN